MTEAIVHGDTEAQFGGLKDALREQLTCGEELGASIVVDIDGEAVVDIWGGHRDAARTTTWDRDTIVNVWSCTKTVTCLSALVLVDRGSLDLDAPVADYWPEFAAHGKAGILVRHLLAHTSGVSGWDQPFALEDMYDRVTSTARLAGQAPWWEPGSASGYHANNQGHLIGELVRRVTGKPLKQFVAQDIAGPLQADFQIGARQQDRDRVADVVPPPPPDISLDTLDPQSPAVRTFTGPVADAAAANTEAWRDADMGAVNGHGNARSLVRVLRCLALGGESAGVRLLSPHTIERIFEVQADGVDLVLGIPLRFGIGFGLPTESIPYLPQHRLCFWGGWGGSMIIMDLDRRMTIGYTMNRMGAGIVGSERSAAYVRAVYAAI